MTTPAYTAQPLGSRGRPIVIDRMSVAWARWRGISMLSVVDLVVEMSRDVRRRPWSTQTQIASIVEGRMVADIGTNDTEDRLEMVLQGVKATIGVDMGSDVVLERGSLRIHIGLPDAYAAGLAGRPLGTIVAMPFPFEATIDEAVKTANGVIVSMRDPWMPLPVTGLTRP